MKKILFIFALVFSMGAQADDDLCMIIEVLAKTTMSAYQEGVPISAMVGKANKMKDETPRNVSLFVIEQIEEFETKEGQTKDQIVGGFASYMQMICSEAIKLDD